jgi:hypothetical protein
MNHPTTSLSDKCPWIKTAPRPWDVEFHGDGTVALLVMDSAVIVTPTDPSYDELRNLFIKIGTAPIQRQQRAEMQNLAVPVHEFEMGRGLAPRKDDPYAPR